MARNLALGRLAAEQVSRPDAATDGEVRDYTGSKGFTFFPYPGYLTIDLGECVGVAAIRLLLWDGVGVNGPRDPRGYKYRLLTSTDRRTWAVLFDSADEASSGWQVFHLLDRPALRYVRIHGLWNSANSDFHIVELEVFDEPPPPLTVPARLEREVTLAQADVEQSDGLQLSQSIDELTLSLERLLAEHDWVNPRPVRELIDNLRQRVNDVASLEQRIGAVRRQIVEPVERELRAGERYTVGSYRLGLLGGAIGVVSLVLYVIDRFCGR